MNQERWANLPKDILSLIAAKFQTHIDILRVRSVCSSWRSSIPPFRPSPHFPVNLPSRWTRSPKNSTQIRKGMHNGEYILSHSTIYRLDPPASNPNPKNNGSWLLRIEESSAGRTRLQNPLLKGSVRAKAYGFPKVLNFLDFRVSELCKVHHVSPNPGFHYLSKVIDVHRAALSSRPKSSSDDYVLLAIYGRGHLCSILLGDDEWTIFKDYSHIMFHDVINFCGKFYAVDTLSRLLVFEELSLQLIEIFGPAMVVDEIGGGDFRLVKSSDDLDLFLVYRQFLPQNMTDLRFFKLNQELLDLEEVNSVGNQVLFLGDNFSFSVSTLECTGLEPDCLYFTYHSDKFYSNIEGDGLRESLSKMGVYKPGDEKVGSLASHPGYSKIFWPPPAWLQPGPSRSPSTSGVVSDEMGKKKKIKVNPQL